MRGGAGPLAGKVAGPRQPAWLASGQFQSRRMRVQVLHHITRSSRGDVEAARRYCEAGMEELQRVRDSCHLAPAGEHPGFVPEINRKHMGLVPPRPVKVRGGRAGGAGGRGALRRGLGSRALAGRACGGIAQWG